MELEQEKMCKDLRKMLKNEFALVLLENAQEEAAENRMSEFDFVRDFEHAEDAMLEVLDMVDNKTLQSCGLNRDDTMDLLEGYWNYLVIEGRFEHLSKDVEEI